MQLFLHLLDGSQQALQVESASTVADLIDERGLLGCRLVCEGAVLSHDLQLVNLKQGSNVYVNGGLEGGKRKRKKKVYTTKKKNKHIHKKIKLLTLSLYNVDGNSFSIFRQGQHHSAKEGVPVLRSWHLHGPALGPILLRTLPHDHQDGPRDREEE